MQDAFFRFLVCVEDGLFGWLDSDKLLAACADTASLNATAVGDCADGNQGAANAAGGRLLGRPIGKEMTRPCGRRPFALLQPSQCSLLESCCSVPACWRLIDEELVEVCT